MNGDRHSRRQQRRALALAQTCLISLALALSGCATPNDGTSNAQAAGINCASGAVIGGVAVALAEYLKAGKSGSGINGKRVAAGAGAGCLVGLAATAVGRLLNDRESRKAEAAFQRSAQTSTSRPATRYPAPAAPAAPTASPTPARPPAPGNPQDPVDLTNGQAVTWCEGATCGGAAPAGPPKTGSDGSVCVPQKEWVVKDGQRVDQEVLACRTASGRFERVVS